MKRVLVILKNPLFAKAIEELLLEQGVETLGVESDFNLAIDQIIELQPDVVVFDCSDEQLDFSSTVLQALQKGEKTRFIGVNLLTNELSVFNRHDHKITQLDDFFKEIE